MILHRFPRTPHVAWLADRPLRADKLLTDAEVRALLEREVVIEEKIDGANLGLSTDAGELRAQNRGSWLSSESAAPQFRSLFAWLAPKRESLLDALRPGLVLFGEWCAAVHSVHYDALPDWFLAFDVLDRSAGRFWSIARRDALLGELGLHPVPPLARGRFSVDDLVRLMTTSRVGSSPMEGVYIRAESGQWLTQRAKLVRAEFVEDMGAHWSRKRLRRNHLSPSDTFAQGRTTPTPPLGADPTSVE